MQEFQERVIEERNDLVEKLNKLQEFLGNPEAVSNLIPGEEARLHCQADIMERYIEVLDERIQYFQ
jgi:hypothetical protein